MGSNAWVLTIRLPIVNPVWDSIWDGMAFVSFLFYYLEALDQDEPRQVQPQGPPLNFLLSMSVSLLVLNNCDVGLLHRLQTTAMQWQQRHPFGLAKHHSIGYWKFFWEFKRLGTMKRMSIISNLVCHQRLCEKHHESKTRFPKHGHKRNILR